MAVIQLVHLLACLVGAVAAGVTVAVRRFGPASWSLSCFLGLGAAASAALWYSSSLLQPALSFLLLAVPCGLLFAWSVDRPDYRQALIARRKSLAAVFTPIPVLLALLFVLRPAAEEGRLPEGFMALGPGGYLASLYLLVVSVLALASLEQIVRSSDERARWEIKFLVLGLAASYAALIYIASKALLYSFRYALLPAGTLNVFSVIFVPSCLLIMISWRRSTSGSRIAVSQSLVYSSITLLSVGIYLIVSSLLARWISQWGELGIHAEAIIFLLSILALAAALLTTQFRHRARSWIRRHVFSGRYDYRRYWLEATEKVQTVDRAEQTADALAHLVQQAVGSIDVSVWLRLRNPDRLRRLASLGTMPDPAAREVDGLVGKLVDLTEPISANDPDKTADAESMRSFIQRTNAELLVPLASSGRLVGLLTVGADRSGRRFDWETREFLGVLANHAAGELHKSELLSTLVAAKEAEAFRSFSTFLLHDLKNFASTLSLIARNAGRYHDNPDFQRDAFQSVYDTAEKMKRLCNSLRTFSGSLALNRRQADLAEIVQSAAGNLDAGARARMKLELERVPSVNVDVEEMDRLLQNLLLNAHEATPADGLIAVRISRKNDMVELVVTDNGKGMSRDFLQKELFLPFRTTKSGGLGIGLFQCKKIVEAHGGTIEVESEEGKGTTVRVGLPIEGVRTE